MAEPSSIRHGQANVAGSIQADATAPKDKDSAPNADAATTTTADTTDAESTARLAKTTELPSALRLFGSASYFRLWLAQVVSSLGDWIGLFAIIVLADRVGGTSSGSAVGLVMSARMVPGFFLASVGGVLVDRWDRKKVMVTCDIGRGLVLASLPFVDTVSGLVLASFLLEVLTLLWAPAKEASVPNLVSVHQLPTANSLSLAAAYGTFPVAAAASALLFKVAEWLDRYEALDVLRLSRESVAIYLDVLTFFLSALLISTLVLPRNKPSTNRGRVDFGTTFRELKEGWRYIGASPIVRSVITGLGTGLFGGAMVVPLGVLFSAQVLGAGSAGFGLLLTALGVGVAAGVLVLSALQSRVPHSRVFVGGVLGAGICLILGVSTSTLTPALFWVAGLGICAGTVYVIGFTLLQENVADEMRGRIFATLYTFIRFCVVLSLAAGPFLSEVLGGLSEALFGADRAVEVIGRTVPLPGVRLTLWLAGLVILVAGMLARHALRVRDTRQAPSPPKADHHMQG